MKNCVLIQMSFNILPNFQINNAGSGNGLVLQAGHNFKTKFNDAIWNQFEMI